MHHPALLAFKVSSFKGFCLGDKSLYFLFSKIFSLSLNFGNLIIVCLGVDLFGFVFWGDSLCFLSLDVCFL